MKKYNLIKFTALIIIAAVTMSFTLAEQGGKGPSTSHKTKLVAGDSYDLFINNWDMPIGRNGVMADVLIPPATQAGGKLQNKIVLLLRWIFYVRFDKRYYLGKWSDDFIKN